jgi:hypothetical protein
MAEEDVVIHDLAAFNLGDLQDDGVALLLAYATSPEKLARREMESFVIGMTRDKALVLGNALVRHASAAPAPVRKLPTLN